MIRVIARRVENGDTDGSVGVYYIAEQWALVWYVGACAKWCQAMVCFGVKPTVRVPHSTSDKLHGGRAQGIVLGELELCCKYTTLEGSASGTLDQGFPVEHVILRNGPSRNALGRICGEVLVFVEEALLRDRGSHGCWRKGWVGAVEQGG